MQQPVKLSASLFPPIDVVEHFPFIYMTALEYRHRTAHKRIELGSIATLSNTHTVQLGELSDTVDITFRRDGRSNGIIVDINVNEPKLLPRTSQWVHDVVCSHPAVAAVRRKLKAPWTSTVSQEWYFTHEGVSHRSDVTPTLTTAVVSSTRDAPRISRAFTADQEQLAALKKWFVDNWMVIFLGSYAELGVLVNNVTDARADLDNRPSDMLLAPIGAQHMHLKKCLQELERFEASMVEVPDNDTSILFHLVTEGNNGCRTHT